ncbi:uncharacterized protein LOC128201238 [Galleria mellonella]|uniref:Uncharacterized protein LOC128201238 n=1 Tax=Galleria mellonella TaxID=7137 RepID=A0ABM3MQB6_GALME|nr:uncharacterized protein LOC128201238 [Galleria mellonella]
MPLPFNKALDLKLLELVKDNPILYNSRHTKYVDYDAREVVWQKIGDALNRPGQVCKSRWINIRDMMRRKVKERLRNPHHRIYNYKYEEELAFMLPYFKEPASNTSEEYPDFLDEETGQLTEVEMPSTVFVDENEYDSTDTKEVKLNVRRRNQEGSGSKENDTVYTELNPTDPIDVFLITVGTTLRKFSPYYLNQAKSKIFQVVQDYELEQIVNKDAQTDTGGGNTNR